MITLNHHHPVNYRDPDMLHSYANPWLRAAHADRISSARFRMNLALRSGKIDRALRAAARLDVVTDGLDGIAAVVELYGSEAIEHTPEHWNHYTGLVAKWEPWEFHRRGWLNEAGRWISA